MEINGDKRPTDPVIRKRQADAAASRSAAQVGAAAEPQSGERSDAIELGTTSPQAIARYVDILKSMNPADLHRVEELRARIQDGRFTATPEELAGPLSDLLGKES